MLDERVRPFSDGMRERRLLRRRHQGAVGHPGPVLRLRLQQGAHRRRTALVSYWTAYLKANYPAEYMAALLTAVGDDKDKSAVYLDECRRMGIKVLPPDVNESGGNFTAGRRRHPLRPGRGPQRRAPTWSTAIVAAREEKGASRRLPRLPRKVPLVVCNKRTIESLIKAGAFDSLGHTRRALMRSTRRGRRGHRPQAQRGERPGRPVRRRLGDTDGDRRS